MKYCPKIYWRGKLPLFVINKFQLTSFFIHKYREEQAKNPTKPILGMVFSLSRINAHPPYPDEDVAYTHTNAKVKYGLIIQQQTLQKAEQVHYHLNLIGEYSLVFELPSKTQPCSKVLRTPKIEKLPLFDHDYCSNAMILE